MMTLNVDGVFSQSTGRTTTRRARKQNQIHTEIDEKHNVRRKKIQIPISGQLAVVAVVAAEEDEEMDCKGSQKYSNQHKAQAENK